MEEFDAPLFVGTKEPEEDTPALGCEARFQEGGLRLFGGVTGWLGGRGEKGMIR